MSIKIILEDRFPFSKFINSLTTIFSLYLKFGSTTDHLGIAGKFS